MIYFAMTDRFCDGDSANNVPAGCDPTLNDPGQLDISRYMGGDLRGMENALQAGYFNKLGITALWLTPVVKNVWRSGYDSGGWKAGYHGYWTQDWLDIDPHLTSRSALDGSEYPDSAEGRMEHYRDFVKLAHAQGIKVIQDVVMNHAGPVFYYDANGDDRFDRQVKEEWVQSFKKDGFHANAKWMNVPEWNAMKVQPDGPRELLGIKIPTQGVLSKLESYGRKGYSPDSLGKSDGEEVVCDFFSLRDFWTAPEGEYFDALVNEFVEIYQFYLVQVGVDGLRIDTIKHVHPKFWDAFTERLRKRLGPAAADKLIFGEVYDGDPARLGQYTWRTDRIQNKAPALDSVLDFNSCFRARDYLRRPGVEYGSPAGLEKSLLTRTGGGPNGQSFYNPNPGPDGLNSQQKIITFIENHDGLNRFRVAGITPERNRLAQALLLTLPGIPCIYYGAECDLLDNEGKIGEDGETGRMMLFRKQQGMKINDVENAPTFLAISKLSALRAKMEILRMGRLIPLWVDSEADTSDDGVFAFARASEDGKAFVVVVFNASDSPRVTMAGDGKMHLPESLATSGKLMRQILTIGSEMTDQTDYPADGPLALQVPASSVVIYEAVAAQ